MFQVPKNILALSPHTDDIEIGCGGTLKKFSDLGSNIYVINYSLSYNGNQVAPNIENEFKQSMKLLGASYEMLKLPVRQLANHRQQILEHMISIGKQIDFDLIFCHSSYDNHQDHQTIQQEAFRAFKHKTILGYELPWNCRQFSTDVFIQLSEEDIKFKEKLIRIYKSQTHRPYMFRDYLKGLSKTRGLQVGTEYAECFELIRGVYQ